MSRLLLLALTIGLLAILTTPAPAQTFGGGVTITGTTNAQLQVAGVVPTNYLTFSLPAKSVTYTGITSTNEVAIYSYGFTIAGSTNVIIYGSFTNTFLTGTNGGTLTTNIPPRSFNVAIVPWAQVSLGSATNTVYVP